jgi:hypothetical protein
MESTKRTVYVQGKTNYPYANSKQRRNSFAIPYCNSKRRQTDEDGQVGSVTGMTCTRRTIIREANAQLAYANAYRCQDRTFQGLKKR